MAVLLCHMHLNAWPKLRDAWAGAAPTKTAPRPLYSVTGPSLVWWGALCALHCSDSCNVKKPPLPTQPTSSQKHFNGATEMLTVFRMWVIAWVTWTTQNKSHQRLRGCQPSQREAKIVAPRYTTAPWDPPPLPWENWKHISVAFMGFKGIWPLTRTLLDRPENGEIMWNCSYFRSGTLPLL